MLTKYNLKYFISSKENWKIPDIFNDYILNLDYLLYSSLSESKKENHYSSYDDYFIITFQKIIDYYKVKNILQLFNDDDYKNFFSNLSKSIKILSVDEKNYSDVKKIIAKEHFDLFVINSNSNESIINDFLLDINADKSNNKKIIIVHDISKNKKGNCLWSILNNNLQEGMRLNINNYGIIFCGYGYPSGEFYVKYTDTEFDI